MNPSHLELRLTLMWHIMALQREEESWAVRFCVLHNAPMPLSHHQSDPLICGALPSLRFSDCLYPIYIFHTNTFSHPLCPVTSQFTHLSSYVTLTSIFPFFSILQRVLVIHFSLIVIVCESNWYYLISFCCLFSLFVINFRTIPQGVIKKLLLFLYAVYNLLSSCGWFVNVRHVFLTKILRHVVCGTGRMSLSLFVSNTSSRPENEWHLHVCTSDKCRHLD